MALSEADDLAVGRGDDDLALGDSRAGRHGRGGFAAPPAEAGARGLVRKLEAATGAYEERRRRSLAALDEELARVG